MYNNLKNNTLIFLMISTSTLTTQPISPSETTLHEIAACQTVLASSKKPTPSTSDSTTQRGEPSMLERGYALLLGSNDATLYKQQLTAILHKFGVNHKDMPQIKIMNSIPATLIGFPIDSFTAHGIWLNEDSLKESSESYRTFLLYHEAAHWVQQHHKKAVQTNATALTLASAIAFYAAHDIIKHTDLFNNELVTYTFATLSASLASYFTTQVMTKPYICRQEESADIWAAAALCEQQKKAVLKRYIKELKQLDPATSDDWHPELKKHIATLEEVLSFFEPKSS